MTSLNFIVKKSFIALLTWGLCLPFFSAEYLVEAESFPQRKDVKLVRDEAVQNGEFLHFTEDNAATEATFMLPQSGDYAVWLRTMSFNGNFRKTQIFIDDRLVATLGDGTPENNRAGSFTWYHAPALTRLKAGKIKIKLVSTSPYTRVDALLLTTSTAFLPQGKMEKIAELQKISEEKQ